MSLCSRRLTRNEHRHHTQSRDLVYLSEICIFRPSPSWVYPSYEESDITTRWTRLKIDNLDDDISEIIQVNLPSSTYLYVIVIDNGVVRIVKETLLLLLVAAVFIMILRPFFMLISLFDRVLSSQ